MILKEAIWQLKE